MAEIERLIDEALRRGAMALHLSAAQGAHLRVEEGLTPLEAALDEAALGRFLAPLLPGIVPPEGLEVIYTHGARRLWVHAIEVGGWRVTCRPLAPQAPRLYTLGLPQALGRVPEITQGLVLLSSPAGHGRSATWAALVEEINQRRACHLLALSQPWAYLHAPGAALLDQGALSAPGQGPLAARLRRLDEEDIDALALDSPSLGGGWLAPALTAAASGLLVLLTIRAQGIVEALAALLAALGEGEQAWGRAILATHLRAAVSQRRLRSVDGRGQVLATSLFWGDRRVSEGLVAGREVASLASEIAQAPGSVSMDDALFSLLKRGRVLGREAHLHAEDKQRFAPFLA
ncbi:hypothetical protein KKF91_05880 [Myxococcota bacterium]|nr:hypothetical protein [Myxococcota bacterium]